MSMQAHDPPTLELVPETSGLDHEPCVSVLLPTTQPWPAVSAALDSLLSQIEPPAFEILVLDGDGQALRGIHLDPAVRWIRLPGLDSFALRAAGIAHARGSVVAITEDHCLVPADWIASIDAVHRADASPAIVGAVCNHPESATSALDRANFLLTFAGQTPDRLRLTHGRLPVPTNISFKRAALGKTLAPGELEYRWLAELLREKSLSTATSVVIEHRQSWGKAIWAVHVASGRSYGATVRNAPFRTRAAWWLRFPFVPLRLMRLVLSELRQGAGGRPWTFVDAVCATGLIAANLSGQFLGALTGPGASRHRL
jgi:hypothetical protein